MNPLAGKRVLFLSAENFRVRFREKKEACTLREAGVEVKFLGIGTSVPEHLKNNPFPVEIIAPHEYITCSNAENRLCRIISNVVYYHLKQKMISYAIDYDTSHRWKSKTGKELLTQARRWRPDAIHCVDAPSLGFAHYVAKKLGVPFVYDCHEWWRGFYEIVDLTNGTKTLDSIVSQEKSFAPSASLGLSTSNQMASKMKNDLSIKTVETLYNSIPYLNTTYRECHSPIRFVFHGTLSKNRGILDLLKALSRVEGDFELHLHGNYFDIFEEEYWDIVESLGIRDHVFLHGPFEYSEIGTFLKEYDVAIWTPPMGKEHFDVTLPNKLFDAICSGLAVAMPNYSSIQEVLLKDQVGIMIDTSDIENVTRAIQKLIDDPKVVSQYKKNSASVARKYSWDSQGEKLIRAYEQLFA